MLYLYGVVTRKSVTESLTNDGLKRWFRKLGHLCHLNSGLNKDTNTLHLVLNMLQSTNYGYYK